MPDITFNEVPIGQRFYDSNTGEYWVKINEEFACLDCDTSYDYTDDDMEAEDFFSELETDRFEPLEIVNID